MIIMIHFPVGYDQETYMYILSLWPWWYLTEYQIVSPLSLEGIAINIPQK